MGYCCLCRKAFSLLDNHLLTHCPKILFTNERDKTIFIAINFPTVAILIPSFNTNFYKFIHIIQIQLDTIILIIADKI